MRFVANITVRSGTRERAAAARLNTSVFQNLSETHQTNHFARALVELGRANVVLTHWAISIRTTVVMNNEETTMKLYYMPGACSQAPHIALRETGASFELIKVDHSSKQTDDGQDFRAINPNGYVPTLQLDDGRVLTENAAVLQYIADRAPQSRLAPANNTFEHYELLSRLNFVATEIHKGFGPLWNPDTPTEYQATTKQKLATRFDFLNDQLSRQPYLLGEQLSIADIYLFVVSGWSPHFGIDPAPWPALTAFRQRIEQRPSVQAALAAEGLK